MKLGHRGTRALRHFTNQPALPLWPLWQHPSFQPGEWLWSLRKPSFDLRLKLYCWDQTASSRAGVTYLYVGAVLLPVDLPAVYLNVGLAVVAWSRHEAGVGRPAPEILVTGHHSLSLLIMSRTLLLCVVMHSVVRSGSERRMKNYFKMFCSWPIGLIVLLGAGGGSF